MKKTIILDISDSKESLIFLLVEEMMSSNHDSLYDLLLNNEYFPGKPEEKKEKLKKLWEQLEPVI